MYSTVFIKKTEGSAIPQRGQIPLCLHLTSQSGDEPIDRLEVTDACQLQLPRSDRRHVGRRLVAEPVHIVGAGDFVSYRTCHVDVGEVF